MDVRTYTQTGARAVCAAAGNRGHWKWNWATKPSKAVGKFIAVSNKFVAVALSVE